MRPASVHSGDTGAVEALVLLVEDDRSIRDVTRMGLSDAGFTVVTAGDGEEALPAFRRHARDAGVFVVTLPHRDGLEVLRAIRHTSSVPVLMLTARDTTTDVVLGLELGADDYMTKPFEMPVLVARLRSVLRRANRADVGDELRVGD